MIRYSLIDVFNSIDVFRYKDGDSKMYEKDVKNGIKRRKA